MSEINKQRAYAICPDRMKALQVLSMAVNGTLHPKQLQGRVYHNNCRHTAVIEFLEPITEQDLKGLRDKLWDLATEVGICQLEDPEPFEPLEDIQDSVAAALTQEWYRANPRVETRSSFSVNSAA